MMWLRIVHWCIDLLSSQVLSPHMRHRHSSQRYPSRICRLRHGSPVCMSWRCTWNRDTWFFLHQALRRCYRRYRILRNVPYVFLCLHRRRRKLFVCRNRFRTNQKHTFRDIHKDHMSNRSIHWYRGRRLYLRHLNGIRQYKKSVHKQLPDTFLRSSLALSSDKLCPSNRNCSHRLPHICHRQYGIRVCRRWLYRHCPRSLRLYCPKRFPHYMGYRSRRNWYCSRVYLRIPSNITSYRYCSC